MKKQSSRGIALVAVLSLMVIVLMLVGVLLKRGQSGLYRSSHYRDGIRAAQAAKGGVNHLLAVLQDDNTFSNAQVVDLGNASYSFTFDATQPHYSVNNLEAATESSQLNSLGQKVAPHSADLILVGRSGNSQRVIHVIAQQGFSSSGSVAAVGRVRLTGEVEIAGIKSLQPPPGQSDPQPAPGGIMSKYRSSSASDPAISWVSHGGNFELSDLSSIETVPAVGLGQGVSANIKAAHSDKVFDDASADAILDIDVSDVVSDGLANPQLAGGIRTLNGYVYVDDSRSVHGNLTVNGNLSLTDGTLFVDGNVTINGGIEGVGAIYAKGDVIVNGGNAVVITEQPKATAIMAGGDIQLQGLDASRYLRDLAVAHGFEPSLDQMEHLLLDYQIASAPSQFWGISTALAKHDGPIMPGPPMNPLDSRPLAPWVSPIPGPDGSHNVGRSNSAIARVILDLKENYPGFGTDPRAQKAVRGLEQLQYHFRHNLHNVSTNPGGAFTSQDGTQNYQLDPDNYQLFSGSTPLALSHYDGVPNALIGMAWDDLNLPQRSHTHDHLGWNTNPAEHISRRDAFFDQNNALDPNWLEESSFQGLVYARGSVSVSSKFRVVGALVTLGDVTIDDDSTLIFNEDYRDLVGLKLPVGIVHFEEL